MLGVGVNVPGLGGAVLGGRRARAEETEESVPFLEMVSEPLVQGKVRGAMASSLIIKEATHQKPKGERGKSSYLSVFLPLHTHTPIPVFSSLKSSLKNVAMVPVHLFIKNGRGLNPRLQRKVRRVPTSSKVRDTYLMSLASSSRVLVRRWYNKTSPASSTSPTRVPTMAPTTTAALDPEKSLVSGGGTLFHPLSTRVPLRNHRRYVHPFLC